MSIRSAQTPKVSVVSISYNQEDFIAQTLDSFLMQETDFDFEVIIADDCSSDKTPEIINDYAKRFPSIVKPILRKKNVGIQNNMSDALSQARGRYIALCEGDDFWTDPTKLQRQADYMDKHAEVTLCFHPVKVFYEKSEKSDEIFPDKKSGFTVKELLKRNFIQTNSVMYRKKPGYENMPRNILPMDWYLHLYHAKDGKLGFIDRVMSSYRRHEGGVWWGSDKDADMLYVKHGLKHVELYSEMATLFNDDSSTRVIQDNANSLLDTFFHVDKRQSSTLVESTLRLYPVLSSGYLKMLHERLSECSQELADRERQRVEEVEILRKELDVRDRELRDIKSSRLWKVKEGVAAFKKSRRS